MDDSTRRVFFDLSDTPYRAGQTGVTRTVRRLREELAQRVTLVPVAYSGAGFREAAAQGAVLDASRPTGRSRLAAVGSWVSVRLPLPLRLAAWTIFHRAMFDSRGRRGAPVPFRPGDVLLLCDACWNYPAWTAARRARAQGAKVVLVLYDLMPLRHPEFSSAVFVAAFRRWLHAMLRNVDAVVCISSATEADLRRYVVEASLPLPPAGHFRLGSDPAPANPDGTSPRAFVEAFLSSPAAFAAVGSFEPKKNYGILLDAFEQLWQQGHDARLLIAGRTIGECEALLQRIRSHPENGQRLLVVHDATDVEIQQIYAGCRALLFPSLMEGFGLPLVEARVQGCPVIASDLPVFAELADAGVTLFRRHSVADLVAQLQSHLSVDRRAQCGRMAPFSWRDSAAMLMRSIELLLHAPGSPAP